MNLRGTGVALVTPFDKNKNIDFSSLAAVIDHCIQGGVNYLVSLGTTGETVTLNAREKQEILTFTQKHVAGRVPLVAGFGGNNTQLIVDNVNGFNLDGYQALLSSSPNYNKPTQEGIYQHYKAVAAASPLPVILYNVPGRTSSNMTAATTLRLAHEVDNIIAVKEASGDFAQVSAILKGRPSDFLVISGDDAITLPLVALGCDGVISVIANAYPKIFSDMVRKSLASDMVAARREHNKLLELMSLIFVEGNPGGVKGVLHLKGICGDMVRLPLWPISSGLYEELKEQVDRLAGN